MSVVACRPAENPEAWDRFVQLHTNPNEFLQSWHWGEFQRAAGRPVVRWEAVHAGALVGAVLLVMHQTRLGKTFTLAPRGPVLSMTISSDERADAWKALLETVAANRDRQSMFLKVEPNIAPPPELGLEPGTGVHPANTLLVDVTKNESALFSDMYQKTRYNVRLSEKKGVRVTFSRSNDAVGTFLKLLKMTADRQSIGVFAQSYYRKMIEYLGEAIDVGVASMGDGPLAAALFIRFGNTYTYVHGASSDEHREAMAPYLLQWEAIRRGKALGCRIYDFFGIAPENELRHRWAGITRFKKGFGGYAYAYPGAFNVVYQRNWYFLYRAAKRISGR